LPIIRLETRIEAPVERCFDLMRDVDMHTRSTSGTGERAVAGVTSGLLAEDDEVTWEATHLGVRQRLTVRVTRCQPPYMLEDQMVRGAFQSMTHRHLFREDAGATVMRDEFHYTSPLGPLGRFADWLFLESYMRRFLEGRAQQLKELAEAS
jgi:ligand-binding SRPBCC domain-containing protein